MINKQIEFFDELNISENRNKIKLIDTNNKTKKEVLENVCEILNLKEREEDREKWLIYIAIRQIQMEHGL